MNKINTYKINNNQNIDLTNVQWIDENDFLFKSFYNSDDLDEEKEFALKDCYVHWNIEFSLTSLSDKHTNEYF